LINNDLKIPVVYHKSRFNKLGGNLIVNQDRIIFIKNGLMTISTKETIEIKISSIDSIYQKCNLNFKIFTSDKSYNFMIISDSPLTPTKNEIISMANQVEQLFKYISSINHFTSIAISKSNCKENFIVRHPVIFWFTVTFLVLPLIRGIISLILE
jgi:hypothetical protein